MTHLFSRKYLISFFYIIVCIVGISAWSSTILAKPFFQNEKTVASLADFPELFHFEREIELPGDEIVAQILTMDVYKDSLAVFTDNVAQKVYRFDLQTRELLELNPEHCHPGYENQPIHAFFQNSGNIFVMNSGNRQGYWFYQNGGCGGTVFDRYSASAPNFITVGNGNKMIRLELPPHDIERPVLEVLDGKGQVLRTINVSVDMPYLSYRYIGGGLVFIPDRFVYLTTPESSKVTEINLITGEQTRSAVYEPPFIKPFPINDIGDSKGIQKMFSYFNEVFAENSLVSSMHILSDQILVQQIGFLEKNERKIALLFYDRLSREFSDIEIIVDQGFSSASNGKVYVVNPILDADPNQRVNPSISVFKYIGPKEIYSK